MDLKINENCYIAMSCQPRTGPLLVLSSSFHGCPWLSNFIPSIPHRTAGRVLMMLIMMERTILCPSERVSSGVCPNKAGCHSLNISPHLIENLGGRTSILSGESIFFFSFYHLTSLSGRNPISVRVRKSEKILDFILATIWSLRFRRMSFLDGEEKKTFSGQRGKIKLNMEKERIKKVQ